MTHSPEKNENTSTIISKVRRLGTLLSETVFTVITVSLLVCLLCAGLSQVVPPSSFILLVYFGLFFPFVAVGSAIWWFIIIFLGKKMQVVFFLPSLLCLGMWGKTFPINGSPDCDYFEDKACGKDSALTVMTYNIMGFKYEKGTFADSIPAYILSQNPDICFLQEYVNPAKGAKHEKSVAKLLRQYRHTDPTLTNKAGKYKILTLSKHPIIEQGVVCKGQKNNSAIYCDIKVGNDTIRLINCHLTSNHLTKTDRKIISDAAKGDAQEREEAVEVVSKKFGGSYVDREHMAVHTDSFIQTSNMPIILAGDFNDVPISFAYHRIAGDRLSEANAERGRGYCNTYFDFPFFVCIDHIMYSEEIECEAYKRDKVVYSDHYPTMARVRIKGKEK